MTQMIQHFVDPSIPGLSGRDLLRRSVAALGGKLSGKMRTRDLRLDRHQLRDIGLDGM